MGLPFNTGDRVVTKADSFNPSMPDQGVVLCCWWSHKRRCYFVDVDLERYGKTCLSEGEVVLDLLGTLAKEGL